MIISLSALLSALGVASVEVYRERRPEIKNPVRFEIKDDRVHARNMDMMCSRCGKL